MAPAPVSPSPDNFSLAAEIVQWFRDWGMQAFGGGLLLALWRSSWRASQWKTTVETTQKEHAGRLDKLERADAARAESHNSLEKAVAALPQREEVRDMINDLRESMLAALQMAGGGR